MKRSHVLLFASVIAAGVGSVAAAPRGVADARSQVTTQQRTMLAEKLALIGAIMQSAGASQAGSTISADQRRWLTESLYAMPVAKLRAMGRPGGYDATAAAIARANLELSREGIAKLGQPNTELVYIPITPCRFIDTRITGGKITGTPIGSRSYDLDVTGAAYGGSASCDPKSFVGNDANNIGAISINLAIIDPSFSPGFMGARPLGSTNTTSMVNWYETGPTVQASNAGIVTTDQTLATDEIEFFGTPTHIVVDILGMFAAPSDTALECVAGTLASASIAAGATATVTAGSCPLNTTMVSTSCQILGGDKSLRLAEAGVNTANSATCTAFNAGGGAITLVNTPWCCRLPGR